jgi:hypothetical protein
VESKELADDVPTFCWVNTLLKKRDRLPKERVLGPVLPEAPAPEPENPDDNVVECRP